MNELNLEMHRAILSIRRSEELLAEIYKTQVLRCPTHFAIGQEAVAVGVCSALDLSRDVVFSHHRSHAHYLAAGGSFEALCAELYGRETGCSRGRGGSVHLTARNAKGRGFIASSAILGEMVAVATGAAWALRMGKEWTEDSSNLPVAVCFFGDAVFEEGIIYESFNFASIHKLPVLFVCENNQYSTESQASVRQSAGTELCDRAVVFRVGAFKADGNDVHEVYKTAKQALFHVRQGQPVLLECATYRHLEHVGPNLDHEVPGRTYRTKQEWEAWKAFDPLIQSAAACDESDEVLAALDAEIQAALKAAAERAQAAPKPDKSELFRGVW